MNRIVLIALFLAVLLLRALFVSPYLSLATAADVGSAIRAYSAEEAGVDTHDGAIDLRVLSLHIQTVIMDRPPTGIIVHAKTRPRACFIGERSPPHKLKALRDRLQCVQPLRMQRFGGDDVEETTGSVL